MNRQLWLVMALAAAVAGAADTKSPTTDGPGADAVSIPRLINYQGYLTDASGTPLNGSYGMAFELYASASGGTAFWSETQSGVPVTEGVFNVMLGSVTPVGTVPDGPELYLQVTVGTEVISPRVRLVSVPYSYNASLAADAEQLGGIGPSGYALAGHTHNYVQSVTASSPLASSGGQTPNLTLATAMGGDLSGNYPNPTVARLQTRPVAATLPSNGQVLEWNGTSWAPGTDDVGGTGDNAWMRLASPNDSVLFTIRQLGIARGGANNMLYGNQRITHTNLGVACTTGTSGQNYGYATVAGGGQNVASQVYSAVGGGVYNRVTAWGGTIAGGAGNLASGPNAPTIGGGSGNVASAQFATVCGGGMNQAIATQSTVSGGYGNSASGSNATVGGGAYDTASANYAAVAGGNWNIASGEYSAVSGGARNRAESSHAAIGGGRDNFARGRYGTIGGGSYGRVLADYATVAGGGYNQASQQHSTVGGGHSNNALGQYATVPGGQYDTAAAMYSFATNNRSVVPTGYDNSAAFNGQTATASNQTRVGTLSKASGTFTIDHPLDPQGKILNHYFIEGPEMLNIYRGSVVLDAAGRAVVGLPDYFDALNRNPQVVLTGIGSSDVYLVEEVSGNRFAVGGKPGIKVNWIATGEREDVSAEATRRMMPVEQVKTGALAGRMLDDEFLSGCMEQLVREGKAQGIDFRTAAGRARYEQMLRSARFGE